MGHRGHGQSPWPPRQAAACVGEEIAGEHLDDALVPVEQHVEGEVDAGRRGDRADRVVDGVADRDPPGRPRVADAAGVVQGQHRLESGQAGRGELGPPLKPAKKWGSTKPVVMRTSASSHRWFSQTGTSPASQPNQRRLASSRASWLTTRTAVEHVTTEHVLQLGLGVAPVGAGGDEHDDAIEPDHGLQHLEQRRDHHVPRLGPGAVAHGDGDASARLGRARAAAAPTSGDCRARAQRGPLVGNGLDAGGAG